MTGIFASCQTAGVGVCVLQRVWHGVVGIVCTQQQEDIDRDVVCGRITHDEGEAKTSGVAATERISAHNTVEDRTLKRIISRTG